MFVCLCVCVLSVCVHVDVCFFVSMCICQCYVVWFCVHDCVCCVCRRVDVCVYVHVTVLRAEYKLLLKIPQTRSTVTNRVGTWNACANVCFPILVGVFTPLLQYELLFLPQ